MTDYYLVIEQKFMEKQETGEVIIGCGKQIKGFFESMNEAEAFIKDKFSPFSAIVQQDNQKYFSTGFSDNRKYYTIRNGSSVYFPAVQLF
jgi:hypothetical protein